MLFPILVGAALFDDDVTIYLKRNPLGVIIDYITAYR
jgi:hypothetical protein